MTTLYAAARAVVMTWDAYIEAHAGRGHLGQDHTRESLLEGGCGLCASAEYGTEVEMGEYRVVALRAALAVQALEGRGAGSVSWGEGWNDAIATVLALLEEDAMTRPEETRR